MNSELTGQIISGYLVGPPIGSGGMGRVYQGLDQETQTPVAIKIMLPEYAQDDSFRQRFLREAELMIHLHHPNIIPVYTYGDWGGYLYIIMQLVRGPSLERILHHRQFSPGAAWQVIRPLAEALGYGHEQKVLHRDLKPGNIFVEPSGDSNHVYLGDFGLGKRLGHDQTLTASGLSVGTPEYMAPEVAMGNPADQRSDLYSLGVMIYELLLGRLPFQAKNPQMTALAHVDQPVPRPRSINPQFPVRLEAMMLQTLAKNPTARYQTAEDLRQAYYEAVVSLDDRARRTCYWC